MFPRAEGVSYSAKTQHCPPSISSGKFPVASMGVPITFLRNSEIFGEGEPATCVYRMVSGAARAFRVRIDGRRQITGFYLPGELFGLEHGDEHRCSAEAMRNSSILVIKRRMLVGAARQDAQLARDLTLLTTRELDRAQNHLLLMTRTSREKISCFLLDLADRMASNSIDLPMPRQDIADYLGVTIETVSRTLTQLETARKIAIPDCRRIVLLDRQFLATPDESGVAVPGCAPVRNGRSLRRARYQSRAKMQHTQPLPKPRSDQTASFVDRQNAAAPTLPATIEMTVGCLTIRVAAGADGATLETVIRAAVAAAT